MGGWAKVFQCVSRCACVCVCAPYEAAAARTKARASGLLLAFFRPPDACHFYKGKKEGRRTKRRVGRAEGGAGGYRCSNHVT